MAVSSGFFNSLNGDRKYNAQQMSQIFDGIIIDGVFMVIGDHFNGTPGGGLTTILGSGKCWFNGTWTLNTAPLQMTHDAASTIYDRIDTVIVDVYPDAAVRANTFKIVKGTPASSPVAPTLIKTTGHYQYPLYNVRIVKNSTTITTANIAQMVGKAPCPYITGPLEGIDITTMVAQWEAEWDVWFAETDVETQQLLRDIEAELGRLNSGTEVMLKTQYAPDATATVVSGNLIITSNYPKFTDSYLVTFATDGFWNSAGESPNYGMKTINIDGHDCFPMTRSEEQYIYYSMHPGEVVTLRVDKIRPNDEFDLYIVYPDFDQPCLHRNGAIRLYVNSASSSKTYFPGGGFVNKPFGEITVATWSLPKRIEMGQTWNIYVVPNPSEAYAPITIDNRGGDGSVNYLSTTTTRVLVEYVRIYYVTWSVSVTSFQTTDWYVTSDGLNSIRVLS